MQAEFRERYGAELSDRELEKAAQAEMVQRMEAQLASEGIDVKGVSHVMDPITLTPTPTLTLTLTLTVT